MPNISAADLQRAKQTLAEGQTIRNEADRELIMNGCWPADGVDLLLNEEGENIAIEGGKVSGIAEAVQRFKARNPDAFVRLEGKAVARGLSPMTRYVEATKQILKTRDRRKSMQSIAARFTPKGS